MTLAEDLLSGGAAIAAFMGLPQRSVYHAAEHNGLPVFRVGAKLHARKSRILEWVADQEAANDNRAKGVAA